MAVASLILSVFALALTVFTMGFGFGWIFIPLAIISLILGEKAKKNSNDYKPYAMKGIVVSIMSIIMGILSFIILIMLSKAFH